MSPFFQAACKHNIKENREGLITLEDMDERVAEEMLKYLYTGKYPVSESMGMFKDEIMFHVRMYSAGDKYLVKKLKEDANRNFAALCQKSRRKEGFVDDFCDAVKQTADLVPQRSMDLLEQTQVREARQIIRNNLADTPEKLGQLFQCLPQFLVSFIGNLGNEPVGVNQHEISCCRCDKTFGSIKKGLRDHLVEVEALPNYDEDFICPVCSTNGSFNIIYKGSY